MAAPLAWTIYQRASLEWPTRAIQPAKFKLWIERVQGAYPLSPDGGGECSRQV